MASAAKSASAFITFLTRTASSSSSQGVVSLAGAPIHLMLKKKSPEDSVNSSWGPDPVTGYYRPDNRAKEIDAADLRRLLLSKNMRNQ